MKFEIYHIDAFTGTLFGGNPAAVCITAEPPGAQWMQQFAAEMNLSETAFVERREQENEFNLRWFTPVNEIELCGHATLASAHVLWQSGRVAEGQSIVFHTLSGALKALKHDSLIELDFPLDRVREAQSPVGVGEALGREPSHVVKGEKNYVLVYETAQQVRALAPDFQALATVPGNGVIVTAPGEGEYDFVSRFFGPKIGINEDPVTGAAHCSLASYWQYRLGKSEFMARQLSERGGTLKVTVNGDRVALAGHAVTVFKGTSL